MQGNNECHCGFQIYKEGVLYAHWQDVRIPCGNVQIVFDISDTPKKRNLKITKDKNTLHNSSDYYNDSSSL